MRTSQRGASPQTELDFTAAFEGPSVESGRMDARDFGPSLFAMGSLVEASSEIYFGTRGVVTLQVRADFRRGSFEFGLVATAAMFVGQQLLHNLSLSDLQLLLRGIGLIGRSPKSLLRLLLRIGDRPIERIAGESPGGVTITVSGERNTVIIGEIDPRVAKLLTTPAVREAVPEIVTPLHKPGITSYRIGPPQRASLRVTKADLPKLKAPDSLKAELADSVAITAVELLSPNFVDGNKWRVAQGGEPFWVRMLDDDFLTAVDSGDQSFMKGDYLIVELRTRAYSSPDGLAVERDILRVIDHKHRAKQIGFG